MVWFWVGDHQRIAGCNNRICQLVFNDVLSGALGCGTSQVVIIVSVVAFVVYSFVNVVIVFVICGDAAFCIIVVIVVIVVVVSIFVIAVMGVTGIVSRGTWVGGAGLGKKES